MFDIGFWELVILFGLGLMVLGPERMPKVATQLGRWAGQARRMARNLTSQIRDEIEPIQSSLDAMNKSMHTDFSARRPEPNQTATDAPEDASENEPEDESEDESANSTSNALDVDKDS